MTQSSTSFPWIVPGDFRERLLISDLVVSETIEDTSALGLEIVDHTELAGNGARVRIDRVFQGSRVEELRFTWFKYRATTEGGIVYSGPPLADFRPHKRYLIFLKQKRSPDFSKWNATHDFMGDFVGSTIRGNCFVRWPLHSKTSE